MQLNKDLYLREKLEPMETQQLEELLHKEIREDEPDGDLVRMLLKILEERMPTDPEEIPDGFDEVWQRYEARRREIAEEAVAEKKKRCKGIVLRVSAIAAVFCILVLAIPKAAGENIFVEFITKVTDEVVAFFSPDQTDNQVEYVYKTNHPGLQQLNDTVAGYGVTEQVVPSWVPEEYVLTELKVENFPSKTRVVASLDAPDSTMIVTYEIYGLDATHEYSHDNTLYDTYENGGIIHDIYLNYDKYLVLWKQNNLECSIVVDCQEDTVKDILKSIYVMEDV